MAPSVAVDVSDQGLPVRSKEQATYPKPLKLAGVLEKFPYEETTPTIGREFPSINIVDDLLNAENADELIRDLAITSEGDLPSPAERSAGCLSFWIDKDGWC